MQLLVSLRRLFGVSLQLCACHSSSCTAKAAAGVTDRPHPGHALDVHVLLLEASSVWEVSGCCGCVLVLGRDLISQGATCTADAAHVRCHPAIAAALLVCKQ